MKKLLFATLVGATSAAAQITGDVGRGMYGKGASKGMMYKGAMMMSFHSVIMTALFLGLTILVWQWVFKMHREQKKR